MVGLIIGYGLTEIRLHNNSCSKMINWDGWTNKRLCS